MSKSVAKSGGASVVKPEKFAIAAAGASIKKRAQAALRPGVEAFLLAAVALGCAQAGWSVLTPSAADAFSATSDADVAPSRVSAAPVVSPFEPNMIGDAHHSHAVAALLSGVQLSGVRQASDPARSGAVLTLNDGAQRAFAIGQEISSGVLLTEVGADYVVVSFGGGSQRIGMSAGPSYSFARAMMGLEPAPHAPSAEPIDQNVEPAAAAWSANGVAWFEAMRAQSAAAGSWRVTGPLPPIAVQAGLKEGDVIHAVNGLDPQSGAASMLAALSSGGRVQIEIMRDAERLTLNLGANP